MSAPTTTQPPRSRGIKGLVGGAVIAFTLLASIVGWYATRPPDVCDNLDGRQTEIPDGYHLDKTNCVANARLATSTEVVVEKVGKQMRRYLFADRPDGCSMVEIRDDVDFYPKGGKITINPPKGEPWDDEPGTANEQSNKSKPPGWYRICKKDAAAWGVDIWN